MQITGSLSEVARDQLISFLNEDSDLDLQLLIDGGYCDAEQAAQIRRSTAVARGTLDANDEFDTSITDADSRVPTLINVYDMFQWLSVTFLIDIELNNGTILHYTTSDRTITVDNGWPGNTVSGTTTYLANEGIINIANEQTTTEQKITDSNSSGGITFAGELGALRSAHQQNQLVNALITFRLVVMRKGNVLIGPLLDGYFRAEAGDDVIDIKNQMSVIKVPLVKTFDNINKIFGSRASYANHNAVYPNDHFMRGSSSVTQSFTWKSVPD